MTQSIIVYRNPVEAAFWESGMAFPLVCGIIAALIVAFLVQALSKRFMPWGSRWYRYTSNVVAGSAIVTMIAVIWVMI